MDGWQNPFQPFERPVHTCISASCQSAVSTGGLCRVCSASRLSKAQSTKSLHTSPGEAYSLDAFVSILPPSFFIHHKYKKNAQAWCKSRVTTQRDIFIRQRWCIAFNGRLDWGRRFQMLPGCPSAFEHQATKLRDCNVKKFINIEHEWLSAEFLIDTSGGLWRCPFYRITYLLLRATHEERFS